jgi:hypothetical protein
MAPLVKYAGERDTGSPKPPQLEEGGGGDDRCDAEEPTGRYAAYTERTITVETELAIALGDGAAYRRLRRRVQRVDVGSRGLPYFGTGSDSIGTGGPGAIVAPGGSCSGAIGAPKTGPLGCAAGDAAPAASGGW